MNTEETLETPIVADDNSVTLDSPIKRGKTEITQISLRKPQSGELRGVQLIELLNMDVASLIKVIPRISTPSITTPEAAAMDPADLLACGSKITDFLLQKSVKKEASLIA
jgi:hypothetical protein